jgi:RNA-directed DNA polymerase
MTTDQSPTLGGTTEPAASGLVGASYRAVDRHARHRLRQWLRGKHKLRSRGTSRFPDQYLHDVLGLVRLSDLPKSFPWAKA